MNTPRKYETPKLHKLDKAGKVTLGNSTGAFLDFNFPVGTPQAELTFS